MSQVHSTTIHSHGLELSLSHEGLEVTSNILGEAGSFSIKLDIMQGMTSSHVLGHVVETQVGESAATHNPQLESLEAVWESSAEVLHPLISDLVAPPEVDAEFSQSLLLRESTQELVEGLEVEV